MNAQAAPSPPVPGSTRYFVLLYTPAARRRQLSALLAIADELAAGFERGLDHSVAHLRLQWWEEELLRFQQRSPRHPWLIAWAAEQPEPLDLRPLVQAATLDLATQRLAARQELQLYATLFVSAAQLLGVSALTPDEAANEAAAQALRTQLEALGRTVATLEAAIAGQAWALARLPPLLQTLRAEQTQAPLLAPAWQPSAAPLLVWLALLVHRWQRLRPSASGSSQQAADNSDTMHSHPRPGRFDALTDNFIAWRHARRALRRRFRVDIR